jgi:hypothetical protein
MATHHLKKTLWRRNRHKHKPWTASKEIFYKIWEADKSPLLEELRNNAQFSWETVTSQYGREHGVESRYQATTGEDTVDWEELVPLIVSCKECVFVIAL